MSASLVLAPRSYSVGVEYDAPERWRQAAMQRSLDSVAPRPRSRESTVSWLFVDWFAGDPWEPVERWVVYEMKPEADLVASDRFQRQFGHQDEWLADCRGPNPRARGRQGGYYDRIRGKFVDGGSLIDRRQWVLFQRHRALAMPTWILQGRDGGHKRTFSPGEIRMLKLHGWAFDGAPAPGELPYPSLDSGAFRLCARALVEMDRLRKWNRRVSWLRRSMGDVRKERAEAEVHFMAALDRWLAPQIREAAEMVASMVDANDLPYYDSGAEIEASEESFLHTQL